ncbi:TnsD family Tn7-like transposition protein [Rubrimonas cliftonensis]|uniref:TniQ protein n=1 Tax=Rubrimonas cliftonensis TaxID=89524 RepID=A0A1H4CU14_9RHOB|nr:TnsD family Tn7-like transposition protein [Rubrimonas cliftonensis]SEA63582.1 TniQ protein [Rubrimonas cliftonensis]
MLTYFPRLLPDELLYSVIARHHRHTCEESPKRTIEALFGDRSVRAAVDLPARLCALAARLPPGLRLTAPSIARWLTLLPYYAAFQSAAVRRDALRAMTRGTTDGLHMRLGFTASRVRPPTALRRCPVCDAEALTEVGELWWRRAHQLPGVLVCPDHGAPLMATSAQPALAGQHVFLAAAAHPVLIAAAPGWAADRAAMALLTDPPPDRVVYRGALLDALAVRELATPTGSVRQRRLGALQAETFAPLADALPEALRPDWLAAITRRRRHVFHPLHYVLLDVLLDAAPVDRARRVVRPRRFLADDADFEARLRAAVATSPVLTRVARELGVDANTVRRHAARLGLNAPWKPLATATRGPDAGTDHDHRRDWATLRAAEPTLSRKALRTRLPAAHAWLRRHDPDWLATHSPQLRRRTRGRARVDWAATDRALAADIGRAATRLLAQAPPVRITCASVERALGRPGWLAPRRAKLPLSDAAVRAVSEDVGAFQARRRLWAEGTLLAEGPAPDWRVRRLAGLRAAPQGKS